jgi:hypothetical protein
VPSQNHGLPSPPDCPARGDLTRTSDGTAPVAPSRRPSRKPGSSPGRTRGTRTWPTTSAAERSSREWERLAQLLTAAVPGTVYGRTPMTSSRPSSPPKQRLPPPGTNSPGGPARTCRRTLTRGSPTPWPRTSGTTRIPPPCAAADLAGSFWNGATATGPVRPGGEESQGDYRDRYGRAWCAPRRPERLVDAGWTRRARSRPPTPSGPTTATGTRCATATRGPPASRSPTARSCRASLPEQSGRTVSSRGRTQLDPAIASAHWVLGPVFSLGNTERARSWVHLGHWVAYLRAAGFSGPVPTGRGGRYR